MSRDSNAHASESTREPTTDIDGRYRISRFLARGGMAEVFAGVLMGAEGFEKPVAIKRMLPKLSNDARFARMFISEARLAKFLHHQNIVEIIDVGLSGSGLFLVMELVNGWDLQIIIQQAKKKGRTFSPTIAVFIAAQVLAGLCHAYRRQVKGKPLISAHRDISTSNVLLSVEGEVKVADFGVARLAGLSTTTESGTFKGKLAYAAPELFKGTPANHLSDQFALGNVLYQMLSTEMPFGRPTTDVAEFLRRLKRDTPPPVSGVPNELGEIVGKMLSKAPDDRFETPEVLARALAEFLSGTGIPAGAQQLTDFLSELELPPPVSAIVEPRTSTLGGDEVSVELNHEPTKDVQRNEVFSLHGWPPDGQESKNEIPLSGFTCMSCGKPLKTSLSPCEHCAGELELDRMKMKPNRGFLESATPYIRKALSPAVRSAQKPKSPGSPVPWRLVAGCVVLLLVLIGFFVLPGLRAALGW